ncbi:GNAT family N-acetyltransferase [Acidisoma sp.]|uniref:GNAT family N-acetyltransferase n=1 Tax=Acidisoma sp. TaxID=1872115 RepID=UPI003AFFBF55
MSGPHLVTPHLVLRRMTLDDAPSMHAVLSDPDAMRYWSTLPHSDLAVTEEWIGRTIASVAAGEGDDFAVLLNDTVIGKAGLWRSHEIGIILARQAWGRGLASEALAAVIERAFGQGVDHIVADIDPRNAASIRLFEKLGFRYNGSEKDTVLLGDLWTDSVYLLLTPGGWSSRNQIRGSTLRPADHD